MNKHKQNVIKEKRTIEATKKNFMGPSGKFGVILKAFGNPIIRQGSGHFDQTFLDDPYENEVKEEFASTLSGQKGPSMYTEEIASADFDNSYNEGMFFDGLSRGMHLEIIYWQNDNKLKVMYKGFPVYMEVAGELESYNPNKEWEDLIERLFLASSKKIKEIKSNKDKEISKKINNKKIEFLKNLRDRWGI